MAPKFRGDSDDWLDNEGRSSSRRLSAHRKPPRIKVALPLTEGNALVVEVFPNQCRVLTDTGQQCLCSYRRAALRGENEEGLIERAPVAVGDRVRVKIMGQSGVVEGTCERRNQLMRPAPDREQRAVHVIAANVDVLLVVSSTVNPDFSPGLVDRFLIAAALGKISSVFLCINKIDLASGAEQSWSHYRELGVEVFEVSAKQDVGVSLLFECLKGKTVLFCGHSGVGKTSLLRTLLKQEVGRVGTVNTATGKGKHTTTGAVLLHGPNQSKWIDTPGVREFGLAGVTEKILSEFFPEFSKLSCAQKGCLHTEEPDCQASSLPRYASYRRILESLRAGEY